MSIGPGKYDAVAEMVLEMTGARGGVLVIVLDGIQGTGVANKLTADACRTLPTLLRAMADEQERDNIRLGISP
jgi:hypothetical protein